MYTTNNLLAEQKFKDLQINQLIRTGDYEVLSVTLEAGSMFPEHSSPKDTHIIVLEGEIYFGVNNEIYNLSALQVFNFEADCKHFVKALTNTKFLIIR